MFWGGISVNCETIVANQRDASFIVSEAQPNEKEKYQATKTMLVIIFFGKYLGVEIHQIV